MKYVSVYVEVLSADGVSDSEICGAVTRGLFGLALKSRDGCELGEVVHVQITDGPKPTRSGAL